jgi:molybdate transport system substrate-binding protein
MWYISFNNQKGEDMKKYIHKIVFITAVLCLAGVTGLPAQESLTVAAAANLSGVINELKDVFVSSHKDVEIEVITGSSGKFTMQVLSGAPFDVFLSADMENPQKLKDAGFAEKGPAQYAQGRLVMFTVKDIGLSKGISITVSTEVSKVSIADPSLAPYGRAAVEALEKSAILEKARLKFVTAGNISEVVTQTINGADLGFTALSLMYSEGIKKYNVEGKYWVEVDKSLYAPIRQGVVILRHGKDNPAAKAFFDFILSKTAREIFVKYGYR